MGRVGSLGLAALTCALVACGAVTSQLGVESSSEEVRHDGRDIRRVRIAPLNLITALPVWFVGEAENVAVAIGSFLEAHDKEIVRGAERDARSLWQLCLDGVDPGEGVSRETAAVFCFVRLLGDREDFDAIVFPTLLRRQAPIEDGLVRWDGVARDLPLAPGLERSGALLDSLARQGRRIDAASLSVLVFDATGRQLFHSYGGLEVVQELAPLSRRSGFHFRRRENLFVEPWDLREGVRVAFEPYLQSGPEQREPEQRADSPPSAGDAGPLESR